MTSHKLVSTIKHLDSKRFECVVPPSEKVVSFKLVRRSTQLRESWGWAQVIIKGKILFYTEFMPKVKTIKTSELKTELKRYYSNTNRKSLGLPID